MFDDESALIIASTPGPSHEQLRRQEEHDFERALVASNTSVDQDVDFLIEDPELQHALAASRHEGIIDSWRLYEVY